MFTTTEDVCADVCVTCCNMSLINVCCCSRLWTWTQRETRTGRRLMHWNMTWPIQVRNFSQQSRALPQGSETKEVTKNTNVTVERTAIESQVYINSLCVWTWNDFKHCWHLQRKWRFAWEACSSNSPNPRQQRWFRKVRHQILICWMYIFLYFSKNEFVSHVTKLFCPLLPVCRPGAAGQRDKWPSQRTESKSESSQWDAR